MNEAHQHLLVNHLPIIGLLISILVLVAGLILKRAEVKRTALVILIFASLTSILAFSTGEGAEEIVEEELEISHKMIHEHEEQAELFYTLILITGGLSLISLWADIKKKSFSKYAYFLVLIFSMISFYFGSQTGNSGGEIRHTEILTE